VAVPPVLVAESDHLVRDLASVLVDIRVAGHMSLQAMTAKLTARGTSTWRGGQWDLGNVRGVLERTRMVREAVQ